VRQASRCLTTLTETNSKQQQLDKASCGSSLHSRQRIFLHHWRYFFFIYVMPVFHYVTIICNTVYIYRGRFVYTQLCGWFVACCCVRVRSRYLDVIVWEMREFVELIRRVEWGRVSSCSHLCWEMYPFPLLDDLPRMVCRNFGLRCWRLKWPVSVLRTLRVVLKIWWT